MTGAPTARGTAPSNRHPHGSLDEGVGAAHSLGSGRPRTSEALPLDRAAHRTLATAVRALAPLPGTATSAMDGWVVAGEAPWRLGLPIVAGDPPASLPLCPGTGREIATGGAIPPNAAGVLRLEHGIVEHGSVEHGILEHGLVEHGSDEHGILHRGPGARPDEPRPGEHIRLVGEEGAAGERMLAAGQLLGAPHLALAAVAGHDTVQVVRPPSVEFILLGSEVVGSGIPQPGFVRDAFSHQLPGLLADLGMHVTGVRRAVDDPQLTASVFESASADLVISTAGTSKGATDHVRSSLDRLGAEYVIDGLDIRPGHPTLLARLPDGRPVLCLPGNPLAAMMMLAAIGVPLVDGLLGRPLRERGLTIAARDFPNPRRSPLLSAYRLTPEGAQPTARQGSGMLRGLAESHGVAVIPVGGTTAGSRLVTLPTPW